MDLKREVSILKNKLTIHESTLKLREQEIAELIALRNKDEDKEDELKKEILSLKQRVSTDFLFVLFQTEKKTKNYIYMYFVFTIFTAFIYLIPEYINNK